MASTEDGDDLGAGQTNRADSGTELFCSPRDGHERNDYVFQVNVGLTLNRINGIKAIGIQGRPDFYRGVWGVGDYGIEGDGNYAGVFGSGRSTNSVGVWGSSNAGYAVLGDSVDNAGVVGRSTNSTGVWGNSNAGYGVHGDSVNNAGVVGHSTNSVGVWGTSSTGYGVLGNSANNAGVVGRSTNSTGVWGNSNAGYGVHGDSVNNAGVVGHSTNSVGVWGITHSGTGVLGWVPPYLRPFSGALAGRFGGPVLIEGNLTVTGAKGAVVPHPDGSHRLLCAVESPESWFEDFGEATLANGTAEIQLDSDFAAVIETSKYHIFLTPYGDSNGLYVADRTPRGFLVKEQKNGTSNLTFSYRIVAKRKDIVNHRLPKVTLPTPIAAEHPSSQPSLPQGGLPKPPSLQPPLSEGGLPRPPSLQPPLSEGGLPRPPSLQPPVSEGGLPKPPSL